MDVHVGGPVETGRGFVLHSADYYVADSTLPIDDGVSLTATIDILKAIAGGKGPDRAILALGYAGWRAGQLESEIAGQRLAALPGRRRSAVRPRPRAEVRAGAVEDRHRSLASRQRGRPRLSGADVGSRLPRDPPLRRSWCRAAVSAMRLLLAARSRLGRAWPALGDGRRQGAGWGGACAAGSLRRQSACGRRGGRRQGRRPGPDRRRAPLAVRSAPCGRRRGSGSGGIPDAGASAADCSRRAASVAGTPPPRPSAGGQRRRPGRRARVVSAWLRRRRLRRRLDAAGGQARGCGCGRPARAVGCRARRRCRSAAARLGRAGVGGRLVGAFGALAQEAALLAHAPLGPARHLQELQHLALRHRLAVEEALAVLAADRAQQADVVLGLDPLDHHLLAELVGERHDRAQDHRAGAVLAAGMQERAVDLDGVEGELVEIGERGIAGAEVVERQAGARRRRAAAARPSPSPGSPSPATR